MAPKRKAKSAKRTAPKTVKKKAKAAVKRVVKKAKVPVKKTKAVARHAPVKVRGAIPVVEVTHLPEAAAGASAPSPGKEEPLTVEMAHQHVTIANEHAHTGALPPSLPDAFILSVHVRSWFSGLPNQDVALYLGDALKGRQTTDTRGEARFGGLAPGEYRVEVVRGKTLTKRVNVAKSRSVTVRFW